MANKEMLLFLLEALKEKNGAAKWNLFKAKQRQRVDLSQAELINVDLKGYNFTRVDLRASQLFNANLAGVDLSYADLSYANLRRAELSGAFLTGANLAVANLEGANMVDTNIDFADLRNAQLCGAYMVGASLCEANLEGANLRSANLKFANLTGARVRGCNVEEANLINANFGEEVVSDFKNFHLSVVAEKLLTRTQAASRQLPVEEDYEELFPEQDCYRVLGIDRNANFDNIQQAYRKRCKEYHPDLVAHLGEKLRTVARREFERVQLAYRSLSHYRSRPMVEVEDEELKKKPLKQWTIEDLEHLIMRMPSNDRIYYNLGVKYFQLGLVDSAVEAYEKAVKINPYNTYAVHNLKIARLVKSIQGK